MPLGVYSPEAETKMEIPSYSRSSPVPIQTTLRGSL
jgi:hypothetical protein